MARVYLQQEGEMMLTLKQFMETIAANATGPTIAGTSPMTDVNATAVPMLGQKKKKLLTRTPLDGIQPRGSRASGS